MSKGAGVLVAIFVAVQIAFPALLLGVRWSAEGSMPTSEYRYSWQMYSTVNPGTYSGVAVDGSERPLDLDDLPLITRAIAYSDDVPSMLCERHPELVSVARSGAEDGLRGHEKVYAC